MIISVVIPAYNCAGSLRDTVTSIVQSGLSDYEILIIDDGSKDSTMEVIHTLKNDYAHVRGIHQDNQGVSAARNRGIQEARGDYILFFDSDDAVDAGAFSDLQEELANHKPDMLMFGMTFDYYHHKKMYRRDTMTYPVSKVMSASEWALQFQDLYECNYLSPVWNKLISRNLLLDHDVYFHTDLIEMEDFLFVVDCLKYCDVICVSDKAVYHYRQDERERGTFNRLQRVESLSDYMIPFEKSIADLKTILAKSGISMKGDLQVKDSVLYNFFRESIRFAGITRIKNRCLDMEKGHRMESIGRKSQKMYRLIKGRHWNRIWFNNMKSRARHFAAIRVKYYFLRQ